MTTSKNIQRSKLRMASTSSPIGHNLASNSKHIKSTKTPYSTLLGHVSGCRGNENGDFAWLKRFAEAPIGLRRPRVDVGDGPVPTTATSNGADDTTVERLLKLKEEYEVVPSDDDDCCMYGHKSNKGPPRPNTTNNPHTLAGCDIEPNQHLAILLKCEPGNRATVELGVVKVVSRPVAAVGSHAFTALVLDCTLKGKLGSGGR